MEQMDSKTRLINSDVKTLNEFKKTLRPVYAKVWADILLGYISLVVVLVAAAFVPVGLYTIPLVIPVGFLVGIFLAYIQLFFHEASHFNIHPDRTKNDFLANYTIGFLFLDDIADYRKIHFEHHRKLGNTKDSENSYFSCLSVPYLLESLLMIRVFKVLLSRKSKRGTQSEKDPVKWQKIIGAIFQFSLLGLCVYHHQWMLLACWVIGYFGFFPLFVSVRQLLEHRSHQSNCDEDYSKVNHGEVNKLFGSDLFSRIFGGAGFNKHLLHHWDPQVSYTRFKELESYYMQTEERTNLLKSRTSYRREFLTLFNLRYHER